MREIEHRKHPFIEFHQEWEIVMGMFEMNLFMQSVI